MASTTTHRSRTSVRVHDAELSTGASAIRDYGEAIALVVAIAMIVAAMVIASTPAENADIPRRVQFGPSGGSARSAAVAGDVVQPSVAGASSTEVDVDNARGS